MRFDVITLFPELFAPHTHSGVTRRAYDSGAIELKLWQLRDHADDAYRRVDDRPFGGGPGMVMLVEPLQRALDDPAPFNATLQQAAHMMAELKPQLRTLLHYHCGVTTLRTRQLMMDLQAIK